jgi:hypothetical protein
LETVISNNFDLPFVQFSALILLRMGELGPVILVFLTFKESQGIVKSVAILMMLSLQLGRLVPDAD